MLDGGDADTIHFGSGAVEPNVELNQFGFCNQCHIPYSVCGQHIKTLIDNHIVKMMHRTSEYICWCGTYSIQQLHTVHTDGGGGCCYYIECP